MTDRPPVHICPHILKTVEFENVALTGTFWTQHCVNTKKNENRTFFDVLNENDKFLGCRYISFASKSCNEFSTVKFSTVFIMCRHRVNASSNFATVTFF